MLNEKERIESLRKAISIKKEKLGVNEDILYLKGLKKFNNLKDIKYPKSVSPYSYFDLVDSKGRFEDADYYKTIELNKNSYVFNRIISEVAKKVVLDFKEITEGLTISESIGLVNKYISEKTDLKKISVEEEKNEIIVDYVKYLSKKYGKIEVTNVIKLIISNSSNEFDIYSSYCNVLPDNLINCRYRGANKYAGIKLEIQSLAKFVATGLVLKSVCEYIFASKETFNFIKDKISEVVRFNEEEFENLSKDLLVEMVEDNNFVVPNFLRTLIVLSMEEMLKESFEIYQYEERLESISSDYAKTYMTKKNIPKKTLAFMEDNNFLNMFGYVEADADCEISKLEALAEEFVELSNKLFLPMAKDHSLRFRKLGKIKANGVYYPGFNTLAVDLDGISSFIHEMMHLIDFKNDILSLDYEFKPLLNKYRTLMDERVDSYGEDSEVYKFWYKGKSKYGRDYYSSNEEAFARMGELYVTNVLGIITSFSKIEYNSYIQKIVYPNDKELMNMVKDYFDELFVNLKSENEAVVFKENITNEIKERELTL